MCPTIGNKVLVVEDDRAARKIYKIVLEHTGYIVETGGTFSEAEKLIQTSQFDAILTDIYLGRGPQGTDLLKIASDTQPDTPVIMITGDPSVKTAAHAIRLGAYDYLCKPVPNESLLQVIERAVELKRLRYEKKRSELENQQYRENLVELVKEKTAEIEQSEKRYRTLFEYSKDPMYVIDENGLFLYLNQATIDLFMYSREEMMAMTLNELFIASNEWHHFQKKLMASGAVKDFGAKLKKRDGTVVESLLTSNVIKNQEDEVVESLGIVRDITPNKRAEDKIRKQEEFLKHVLDTFPSPFLVIDINSYIVEIANSAAKINSSPANKTCYAFTHGIGYPCTQEGNRCVLEEVKKTKKPSIVEHVHCDDEGNVRSFEIHGFPIFDNKGKLVRMIECIMDVTERKRLESIAEATNLMKNIGYVFSGIRHEIGNPVNSIKMTIDVLKNNLENYSLETTREFLDGALSEVSRVEYLLKALKNFSLFERPELQSTRLENFFYDFVSIVYDDFKNKGIQIKPKLSPDVGWANIDPRAFHQVMLNLFANAADALKNQKSPQIIIHLTRQSGTIYLTIEDNGCGMTVEEQENLFKPFYTSKINGTGLGLVIVKKMLSKMGCSIGINSQKGAWTKVIINIPEMASAAS